MLTIDTCTDTWECDRTQLVLLGQAQAVLVAALQQVRLLAHRTDGVDDPFRWQFVARCQETVSSG